jgi:Ca-activated chloride channel homolog
MKVFRRLIPAAAALFILPPVQPQETPTFSTDVKRVVLYATVREGKARFVGDLEKLHFTVLEDGKPQEVLSFSRDDVPVAVGVIVDNSGSMLNKRAEAIAAAKTFVQASNPADEIFVLHFNEELRFGLPLDVPFTGDRDLLGKALDSVVLTGKTALYDAIHQGLEHLKMSKLTKKALLVISDGGDNVSRSKFADVVREADLSGALFYAIGIYDAMDGDADPKTLRRLAESTGGEAYFPSKLKEASELCATIARDLRSQYMLSYAPNSTSGGYHKIEVKVKDPKGRRLIVRTRTGYFSSGSADRKDKL